MAPSSIKLKPFMHSAFVDPQEANFVAEHAMLWLGRAICRATHHVRESLQAY
ncbi:hypothetical protein PGTUg99_029890 [Puccinia graminis f. sp. tritici]|uniref:Uncharacterized protein n=1 Tax=Puccinia graminis f. sp. tritici TaxID=56615 RepID=A0A5B0S8K4_PUCGR|nr:hypothetical protein PGTUg99_029282 [Puccinia graminis f. sp. tritici]KAA1134147.1 hypothetical protein PGTUg99_029890 [Puccinia graminis f. sp. tritici]